MLAPEPRNVRLNRGLVHLHDHVAALDALARGGTWPREDEAALRRAALAMSRAALFLHSTLTMET